MGGSKASARNRDRRRRACVTGGALAVAALAGTPGEAAEIRLDPEVVALLARSDEQVLAGDPPTQGPASPPSAPRSIVRRGLVDISAPLLVNDRLVGEIDIQADAAGAGDIDATRLLLLLKPQLDAAFAAALTARIAGRTRVPLADLSLPPLSIVYDPASLEIRVAVPTARLQEQGISFRGYDTPDPSRFMPQADYAGGVALGITQRWIESGQNRGRAPMLVSADAFATLGAFPGVTLRGGGLFTERDRSGFRFERAQTRLTYDSFGDAVHYVVGEFTPALSGFQGGAPVLGIGVARDYAGIRPFENIRPSGRGSVTLDRASTVIVEVNGVETRRLQLDPGRYQLTDFSAAAGANDVRLFVQDDLGRREVASAAFFTATALLAQGLTDFGMAAGKRESTRTSYGGPLTATAYIRHGFSGNLTFGGGGQFASGDWQAGAEAVAGTPVGLFRLQGALSDVAGRTGRAVSFDWLHTFNAGGSAWSITVLSSLLSHDFASPFDRRGRFNDQRWRIDARADWRRDAVGFTLAASFARLRSGRQDESVAATGYYTRGRLSYTGSAGFERFNGGRWGPRALIGLSLQIGRRATASLRADTRRGAVVAEYSRFPVDQVGDLSGRVQILRDAEHAGLGGEARYFGNRFIASGEQSLFYPRGDSALGTRETVLRASTFIGIADGAVAVGRPTAGNFAIYDRHASLAGAKVTVRDEASLVVGKQDWLGPSLVPFNRAFSPVYQTYEVEPLPPGYDLGESRLAAFPGAYSGYRVAVGSNASRVAVGYLIAPSGPIAGVAGTVEPTAGGARSPRPFFTNAAGRFAVDGLEPGTYRMLVGGTEVGRFTLSPKNQGMIDVGRIAATAP